MAGSSTVRATSIGTAICRGYGFKCFIASRRPLAARVLFDSGAGCVQELHRIQIDRRRFVDRVTSNFNGGPVDDA